MKKTHKLLFPNMCSIHFQILQKVFLASGYDIELLSTTGHEIVDEGLKYVHNDTCYPALLTTGQLISALKSGKYDLDHVALVMSQTGGGCRASNYIHLLRKGLKAAGYENIPVVSVNLSGLEKNSGFKITLPMMYRALAAVTYGDLLMLLSNQTRPYEVTPGETDRVLNKWIGHVAGLFEQKKGAGAREMNRLFAQITRDFASIPIERVPKPKVGVVGEIYVKYCPLGNNDLENFLREQGCEVMTPGLLGFFLYCMANSVHDVELYGGSLVRKKAFQLIVAYLENFQERMFRAVRENGDFTVPSGIRHLEQLGQKVIGIGCKMGEGWLLPAEMMELAELGYENIVCTQPFGCLPNHIVGKGVLRKIKEQSPRANIVAVDYDPGATRVNQENRIKLMLAVARENMTEPAEAG